MDKLKELQEALDNRPSLVVVTDEPSKYLLSDYHKACKEWEKLYQDFIRKFAAYRADQEQHAIRLLICRAGGRDSMFEAGELYQTLLCLGLKDSRPGKMFEQENYYNSLVLSCRDEDSARKLLKKLLAEGSKGTI